MQLVAQARVPGLVTTPTLQLTLEPVSCLKRSVPTPRGSSPAYHKNPLLRLYLQHFLAHIKVWLSDTSQSHPVQQTPSIRRPYHENEGHERDSVEK